MKHLVSIPFALAVISWHCLDFVSAAVKCYECHTAASKCGTGECSGNACIKVGAKHLDKEAYGWGCEQIKNESAITDGCKASNGLEICYCKDKDFCNEAMPISSTQSLTCILGVFVTVSFLLPSLNL